MFVFLQQWATRSKCTCAGDVCESNIQQKKKTIQNGVIKHIFTLKTFFGFVFLFCFSLNFNFYFDLVFGFDGLVQLFDFGRPFLSGDAMLFEQIRNLKKYKITKNYQNIKKQYKLNIKCTKKYKKHFL